MFHPIYDLIVQEREQGTCGPVDQRGGRAARETTLAKKKWARDTQVTTCPGMAISDPPDGRQAVLDREGVELKSEKESVTDSDRDPELEGQLPGSKLSQAGSGPGVPGKQDGASLFQTTPISVSIISHTVVLGAMAEEACDFEVLSPEDLRFE